MRYDVTGKRNNRAERSSDNECEVITTGRKIAQSRARARALCNPIVVVLANSKVLKNSVPYFVMRFGVFANHANAFRTRYDKGNGYFF